MKGVTTVTIHEVYSPASPASPAFATFTSCLPSFTVKPAILLRLLGSFVMCVC